MLNLIRSDIYKMIKMKSFYVIMIVIQHFSPKFQVSLSTRLKIPLKKAKKKTFRMLLKQKKAKKSL